VRDANNNLVEGQTVNFLITQDPTGGSLSVASALTNVQGQATTVYTATNTTSASNGVVISATVAGTAVTSSTSLTVGGETVFLSLGTGNTINEYSTTQYEYPYTVQAIDSAGNGVNNVTVSFTVTSLGYYKGVEAWNGTFWSPRYSTLSTDPDAYILDGFAGCLSEDLLNNGIFIASEDYNGNGKLDPGLVVSTDVGSAVTANGGSAAVNLIYPKDHSYWVAVKLTATAIVSGNQNSASTSFILPGASADFSSQSVAPPGPSSPYGIASTCKNPN
jgi:cold shock CspA family protein